MAQQQKYRDISLEELLTRLGFEWNNSNYMDCPFCKGKKVLHLELSSDYWRCNKCRASGRSIHFFSKYILGNTLGKHSSKDEKNNAAKELREFMDGVDNPAPKEVFVPAPKVPTVSVADDDSLHAAYSAMLNIPELQLLPEHKESLIHRGLSEEAIIHNGYRSIPENYRPSDFAKRLYQEAGGEERRRTIIDWLPSAKVQLGLLIAHIIEGQGISLQGVPGFFKFGSHWCFYCLASGILIPTRNIKGQIVLWQIRKKHGKQKYKTVSKQDLPGHVNAPVCRCHFPLANDSLHKGGPLLLTEGPLKADVACHLHGHPVSFVAILGVSNTKDLYEMIPTFKRLRVRLFNAYDMDRLTNKNVREGVAEISKTFEENGLVMEDLYWGTAYAYQKYLSLSLMAKLRNVPVSYPFDASIHEQLNAVATALDNAGVNTCTFKDARGKEVELHWEPETKGIDDFLYTCKKSNSLLW